MNASEERDAENLRVDQALQMDREGRVRAAESAFAAILEDSPGHLEASVRLASFAFDRGDAHGAVNLLEPVVRAFPANAQLALDLAFGYLGIQQPTRAVAVLEAALSRTESFFPAWLLLGEVREKEGDAAGALKAWYQAVTRAQRVGAWHDQASTPPHMLDAVVHAIACLRRGKRELFFGAYDDLRQKFGNLALRRVDRALSGYLGEWDATPVDFRQRPRLLYFPDLPSAPYLNPFQHAWAGGLRDAFSLIREEAVKAFTEDQHFDNFVELRKGGRMANYVGGNNPMAAWEALFFYRHGVRRESTHQRCPRTSKVLEELDLCRIEEESPEICFSVLAPKSHILPHYGVTNTRSVMHLPLVIPDGCALNIIDVGEHKWKEGELVLFDDTFQHEAWNRSKHARIILLMDCWNPYLTEIERMAIKQLIETIGSLHRASRSSPQVHN